MFRGSCVIIVISIGKGFIFREDLYMVEGLICNAGKSYTRRGKFAEGLICNTGESYTRWGKFAIRCKSLRYCCVFLQY